MRGAATNASPPALLEFESPSAAIIATRPPPLARMTNLLVFVLVVSLLVAGGVIQVDRIVSARGKLTADSPNIQLQPFDDAIIASIHAKRGDIVRKGQVLARLNPTFSTANVTAMRDQVELLSAVADRLQAESVGGQFAPEPVNPHTELQEEIFLRRLKEYDASMQGFDQRISQTASQVAGAKSQANFYQQRLGLAAKVQELRQTLQDRQYGSLLNTLLATDVSLSMASALAHAETDGIQAGRQLAAQQAEREAFVQRWNGQVAQDLADTRRNLVQAQQDFAKADLHHELVVLRAPRDAIVLSVAKVSVGSVVTSAEPLIQLVPLDVPLSVEADISGIDSGYVRPGDEVTIKFDTLPYLQYGSGRGAVRSISADSFSPEVSVSGHEEMLPNRPQTLFYKGDIALQELTLHNTPEGFRLVPGMPVTADVKVGERSVLAYFITKILPVAYDSMHEP